MCAFERVPNEQEMRKALEEKEAVSEEAERKEFQGEGAPMVLGRLINYA